MLKPYKNATNDLRGILTRYLPTTWRTLTDERNAHNALLGGFISELKSAETDMYDSKKESFLATATGRFLDDWGQSVGVGRSGRNDDEFREEIKYQLTVKRGTIEAIISGIKHAFPGVEADIYEPWRNTFILNKSYLNGPDHMIGSYYRYAVIRLRVSKIDNLNALIKTVDSYKDAGVTVYITLSTNIGNDSHPQELSLSYSIANYTNRLAGDSLYKSYKLSSGDLPVANDNKIFINNKSNLNSTDVLSGDPALGKPSYNLAFYQNHFSPSKLEPISTYSSNSMAVADNFYNKTGSVDNIQYPVSNPFDSLNTSDFIDKLSSTISFKIDSNGKLIYSISDYPVDDEYKYIVGAAQLAIDFYISAQGNIVYRFNKQVNSINQDVIDFITSGLDNASINKVVSGRNYWSYANRILGKFIYTNGSVVNSNSNGVEAYNPNYFDVQGGQTITVNIWNTDPTAPTNAAGRLAYYDKDKNFLSVSANITITKAISHYLVPANTAYFRISLFKYDDIRMKVEIGTIATDYTVSPEDIYPNNWITDGYLYRMTIPGDKVIYKNIKLELYVAFNMRKWYESLSIPENDLRGRFIKISVKDSLNGLNIQGISIQSDRSITNARIINISGNPVSQSLSTLPISEVHNSSGYVIIDLGDIYKLTSINLDTNYIDDTMTYIDISKDDYSYTNISSSFGKNIGTLSFVSPDDSNPGKIVDRYVSRVLPNTYGNNIVSYIFDFYTNKWEKVSSNSVVSDDGYTYILLSVSGDNPQLDYVGVSIDTKSNNKPPYMEQKVTANRITNK